MLLLNFANGTLAAGAYQRTRDGKTLVWNNYPEPNDAAVWSGARDADGYATGRGTLTWYTKERVIETGSNIATPKDVVLAHYTGNMVHGKFDGLGMMVDARGKTFHGTFVDGRQAKDWVAGPAKVEPQTSLAEASAKQPPAAGERENASPISAAKSRAVSAEQSATATSQVGPVERPNEHLAVEPPAEGPPAGETPDPREQKSQEKVQPPSPETSSSVAKTSRTTKETDDSLRALTAPPTSLHVLTGPQQVPAPTSAPSPASGPRLTARQVMDLADTEVRTLGYDLGEYELPKAQFNPAVGTWSVVYVGRDLRAAVETGKRLNLVVDDKTKKAVIQSKK